MRSDKWSPWSNHPGFSNEGLTCNSSSQVQISDSQEILKFANRDVCLENLAQVSNSFCCRQIEDNKWDIFSIPKQKASGGFVRKNLSHHD